MQRPRVAEEAVGFAGVEPREMADLAEQLVGLGAAPADGRRFAARHDRKRRRQAGDQQQPRARARSHRRQAPPTMTMRR
jgi:hypothetical protein